MKGLSKVMVIVILNTIMCFHPNNIEAGKTCEYARCHEKYNNCEPGSEISFRKKCDTIRCYVGETCSIEFQWGEVAPN
ncbi:hypothetical protein GCM10026987_21710 [Belliella aquatica]|uniref:Uncharacterized protein n=1 Tax=Belliella aquatica TaxID=1323734 RepID=A0ABQ1MLS5_9BACT|nr:hypothetical protein GCM10010993_21800 [Belliella aquatica]